MNIKINTVLLMLFLSISILFADGREKININENWKFKKGEYNYGYKISLVENGWEKINIPHTWNVWDSFDDREWNEDPDFEIAEYYYRGPGWYRKVININENDKGKQIFVEFEAANAVTEVWLNENYLGKHIGGYGGFKFDITKYINYGGKNLLAVRVDNSYNYDIPPQRADYTMYGGIYRDVYLVKTFPVYIENVLISTPHVNDDKAEVKINSLIINKRNLTQESEYQIIINDPAGNEIINKREKINSAGENNNIESEIFVINSPQLWSPDKPELYSAEFILFVGGKEVDRINNHFGLRWFLFNDDDGFFLNGKYLKLHGVNRHQDRYGYGNALSNEQHREDIRMIKGVGANFLRLAHYQQDPVVLNMCDSLGLIVWEEIPVITSVGREVFKENAKNMLREMITQHYNHPSIVMWGLMNETVRSQPDDELFWNVELCKELSQLAEELDPYRVTTQAQMIARGEDILKYTDVRGWNKYYGWYYDTFEHFGKFIDEQKALAPDQPFVISEYGAGSKIGYHIENPTEPDFSEEWALEFHRSHWKQILDRKWIAGSAIWNMFDFASDEKNGNIPHINQKGLASFDRKPKDVFYFYQSQWSKEPMIYIVSHTWLEREGKKDEKKKLEVFSNCAEVEVFLNGKSLGVDNEQPFVWEVNYKEGKNKINAVGRTNNIKVEDTIEINYKIVE
ncbi:MAG: glycoside hydrolase family 2 protein [Melioribacteraceae bacterium]|nr:MAG: glycoside hydrolase family 2 protein [Melioribacteraceae bacterium]